MTYVITGVPGQTLILHATHHCMIDGASGVELMAIIYDFDVAGDPVPPVKNEWTPQEAPSASMLFNEALSENLEKLADTDWGHAQHLHRSARPVTTRHPCDDRFHDQASDYRAI